MIKKIFFILVSILFCGYYLGYALVHINDNAILQPPAGNLKYWQEPIQKALPGNRGKKYRSGQVRYMAEFEINARVLNIQFYTGNNYASISPMDLGLGWKQMSNPLIYKQFKITINDRQINYKGKITFAEHYVRDNITIIHIIPATPDILRQLRLLELEDIVGLKGYLVNYSERSLYHMFDLKTSLEPDETEETSGKVMYVTDFEIL